MPTIIDIYCFESEPNPSDIRVRQLEIKYAFNASMWGFDIRSIMLHLNYWGSGLVALAINGNGTGTLTVVQRMSTADAAHLGLEILTGTSV